MHVVQGSEHLLEQRCRLLFTEEFVLNNSVKELATPAYLSDDVDVLTINEILVQLDDIGVVELG